MYVDSGAPRLDAVLQRVNQIRAKLLDRPALAAIPVGGHSWISCPMGKALGPQAKLLVASDSLLSQFVHCHDKGHYPMLEPPKPTTFDSGPPF